MGCSPYFMTTGAHPLLPFDISEANYLLLPPDTVLSMTDLIAHREIALQKHREQLRELHNKVFSVRLKAAVRFKKEHAHTIEDFDFKLGELVLVRNTTIEKTLNRKMFTRYLGPLIILSQNKGGAYIVAELDGSVFDRSVAAFRVIPYFVHAKLNIPPLEELIDISQGRLQQLVDSEDMGPDDEEFEGLLDDD